MTADPNMPDRRDDAAEPVPMGAEEGEAWLTQHPEVFGEHGDLPRLRELWQSAPPLEPADAAWTATRARIEASLPGRPRVLRRRWPLWASAGALLAAAAAVVAVMLSRPGGEGLPKPSLAQPTTAIEGPFAVAEAEEVHIVSMDPRDVAALVVGEPPIADEFVFAAPADVKVIKVEPCPVSGRRASLVQGDVPMLFTTVARAEEPDDGEREEK
jgi:hypothetical protein